MVVIFEDCCFTGQYGDLAKVTMWNIW